MLTLRGDSRDQGILLLGDGFDGVHRLKLGFRGRGHRDAGLRNLRLDLGVFEENGMIFELILLRNFALWRLFASRHHIQLLLELFLNFVSRLPPFNSIGHLLRSIQLLLLTLKFFDLLLKVTRELLSSILLSFELFFQGFDDLLF